LASETARLNIDFDGDASPMELRFRRIIKPLILRKQHVLRRHFSRYPQL